MHFVTDISKIDPPQIKHRYFITFVVLGTYMIHVTCFLNEKWSVKIFRKIFHGQSQDKVEMDGK